ncbi:MAG: SWIM zinc finger family protein [Selenomonadaceae bacterium]|nr:SWIM zinc finger family protein [Selenomonadaceae bacterium]MBR4384172.1 SWIM zinc finger family protein [Selenomonadaceae bacterium]
MEKFEQTFEAVSETTGEIYNVTFVSDGETVKAQCTCPAGQKLTLCKHVLKCIDEHTDIRYALTQCGLMQIYEEHLLLLKESEKIKREAKSVKKKFERLLLR